MTKKTLLLIIGILFAPFIIAKTPGISFVDPTPHNNSIQSEDFILLNTSVIDPEGNYTYGFTDFFHFEGFIPWLHYDELIRWYRFENDSSVGENSTHIYDWSKYNQNATSKGAEVNEPGIFGKSAFFDDVSTPRDYISLGSSAVISLYDSFTLSMWFKPGSLLGSVPTLYGEGDDPSGSPSYDAFQFYIDTSDDELGAYIYALGDNPYPFVHGGTVNSTTTWYHGVFIKVNSTFYQLYLDGVNVDNYTNTSHGTLDITDVRIGSAYVFNTEYPFSGWIDDTIMFRRALSFEEVQNLYNVTYHSFQNNYTTLDDGTYKMKSFTVDTEGNKNETDYRYIEVDSSHVHCQIDCSDNPTFPYYMNCIDETLYFLGNGTATVTGTIENQDKTVIHSSSSSNRCTIYGIQNCFA